MKILSKESLQPAAAKLLEDAGHELITINVADNQIVNYIQDNQINGLIINTSKLETSILDQLQNLTFIANTNLKECAIALSDKKQLIKLDLVNANAVSELVFAHLLNGARNLHDANRNMPLEGDANFNQLNTLYQKGIELEGKTLGLVGVNKAAEKVAKKAVAFGMQVIYYDPSLENVQLSIEIVGNSISVNIPAKSKSEFLSEVDFISFHTGPVEKHWFGKDELAQLKPTVGIINVDGKGALDEVALVEYLDNNKLLFAGLDTFESEPSPEIPILMNPKISLSPNIAKYTIDSKMNMEIEMAKIIAESY